MMRMITWLPTQSGVKFKPQAAPRIALSHNFGNALSLHGVSVWAFLRRQALKLKTPMARLI